jgi:epoxyqueuosine reductase
MLPSATIKQRALEVGFDLVGIAPPSALKDLEFLPQWIKKGYGGEMSYLSNPRREDPRLVLPSVKSIICVGLIYNTTHPYSTETAGLTSSERDLPSPSESTSDAPPRGWISRYAWGKDYHKVMRKKLEQLRATLEQIDRGVETRVYVDTGPIMERAFARLSGIGWMGKNTCVINEQKGSWFFLGVILTNLELELDIPAPDRCGSCTRCLEACPTGALTEPYVMDASRCIAYLNIELRGAIPAEFRTAIGRNVFGCDICQDVCPWNGRMSSVISGQLSVISTPSSVAAGRLANNGSREDRPDIGSAQRQTTTAFSEFQPMQVEIKSPGLISESTDQSKAAVEHSPTFQGTPARAFSLFNPTVENLASMTEQDFKSAFAHSPIKRAKYRGWLRNLCVVMGNSGDRRFIPWLESALANSDPLVAKHAVWALRTLDRQK